MATSIPRFVAAEMRTIDALCRFGFLAGFWQRALIAVLRMEPIVHVALKVAGAMKPWASANEPVPVKPLRPVIASRGTVIRSDVIVAIGTFGGYSDGDANLSLCFGSANR
jgi:hypothetical protein